MALDMGHLFAYLPQSPLLPIGSPTLSPSISWLFGNTLTWNNVAHVAHFTLGHFPNWGYLPGLVALEFGIFELKHRRWSGFPFFGESDTSTLTSMAPLVLGRSCGE